MTDEQLSESSQAMMTPERERHFRELWEACKKSRKMDPFVLAALPECLDAIAEMRAELGKWKRISADDDDTIATLRADNERLREKLQNVRDWLCFNANAKSGIVAEIDASLDGEAKP